MSRSWAGGSTSAWRKVRALVLARDQHRCQLQLAGCTHIATQAHHVLGRAKTGDDPAHLTAACWSCNRRVGEPQGNPEPAPSTRW